MSEKTEHNRKGLSAGLFDQIRKIASHLVILQWLQSRGCAYLSELTIFYNLTTSIPSYTIMYVCKYV